MQSVKKSASQKFEEAYESLKKADGMHLKDAKIIALMHMYAKLLEQKDGDEYFSTLSELMATSKKLSRNSLKHKSKE